MLSAGEVIEGSAGRYKVVSELGRGGFGVTWRGVREADELPVVLKQLRLERIGDWKAVELFEREGKILQSLDHANIPAYIDELVLEREGQPAGLLLVQSFVPGETLQARMRRGAPMDGARMLDLLRDMLGVLVYLHGRKPPVIHRDISPKNIIIAPDGRPWLIDFGTVQAAISSGNSVASTAAGTFGYAPMEQFLGRALPQSDLYGLAMTAIACATGQEPEALPFVGPRLDVRAALAAHGVALSGTALALLERMVDPDAARRPASAAECLTALPNSREQASGATVSALAPAPRRQRAATTAPRDQVDVWRQARAWLDELGEARFKRAPGARLHGWEGVKIGADGRRALLWRDRAVALLNLEAMEASVHALPEEAVAGALAEDGQSAALIAKSLDKMWIVTWPEQGGAASAREVKLKALSGSSGQLRAAMSLEHGLVAIAPLGEASRGKVSLLDLKTGALVQSLDRSARDGLTFSPGGAYLCCTSGRRTILAGTDNTQHDIEASAIAFSRDGTRAAVWSRDQLLVGPTDGLVNDFARFDAIALPKGRREITSLALSPSGSRLLLTSRDPQGQDQHMLIFDLARPGAPQRVEAPAPGTISACGWCADEERVAASATCYGLRGELARDALLIWRVRDGAYVGAAAGVQRGGAGWAVVGVAPAGAQPVGLLGRLDDDSTVQKGGKIGRIEDHAAIREALARGLALDEDAQLATALDELELRQRFWAALQQRKALPSANLSLDELVERSDGVTHLLPLVPARAATHVAQEVAQRPRFGAAPEPKATIPPLEAWYGALRELRELDRAAQDALFEQMIAGELEADLKLGAPEGRAASPRVAGLPSGGVGYKPMSAEEAASAPMVRREDLPPAELERARRGGAVQPFFERKWMPELVATGVVASLLGVALIVGYSLFHLGVTELGAIALFIVILWPFLADSLNPEQRRRKRRERDL